MNNLTKTYTDNHGFRSIVNSFAIWTGIVPDDAGCKEWLLGGESDGEEPCATCWRCFRIEALTSELHRVQAENHELKQKLAKLKEVLR